MGLLRYIDWILQGENYMFEATCPSDKALHKVLVRIQNLVVQNHVN